jgi:hypothetical protein
VSFELQRYVEPLNSDELKFLERKESTERAQYYKVFQLLMILSFIIPFVGAWYRAYDGAPNAFSTTKFFFTASVLLFISSFSTYLTYCVNLRKVQLDLRDRTKTIEVSHVTRKLQIPSKKAYYLYIDSTIKLSIEVSYEDYVLRNEGDEVCIEYTTHSKLYLGYF